MRIIHTWYGPKIPRYFDPDQIRTDCEAREARGP